MTGIDPAMVPQLIRGELNHGVFRKVNGYTLKRALEQLPPSFAIRTASAVYPVHRILALTLCNCDLSIPLPPIDLTDIAAFLSGRTLIVEDDTLADILAAASLLQIQSLLPTLDALSIRQKKFARPFAVASLHQHILALSPDNYDSVFQVVTDSVFFRDESEHFVIAEFLPVAAVARPAAGDLVVRLATDLAAVPSFRATLRRVIAVRISRPRRSLWLAYRLFVAGIITIDDVKSALLHSQRCPRYYGNSADDIFGWFEPELSEDPAVQGLNFADSQRALLPYRTLGENPDPLLTALRTDDVSAMESILSSADVDLSQPLPAFPYARWTADESLYGSPALPIFALALYFGSVRCVRALLLRGVNFDDFRHLAVRSGVPELIRMLGGPAPNAALHAVVQHRNAVLAWLAESSAAADLADPPNGDSLGLAAIKAGNLEALISFVVAAVRPEFRAEAGRRILAEAVTAANTEVVRLLLAVPGIELNTSHVEAPLPIAVRDGLREIADVLIADGRIDIGTRDSAGKSALVWALQRGDAELARAIAERTPKEEIDRLSPEEKAFIEGNAVELN
jgi:hypothetical protein